MKSIHDRPYNPTEDDEEQLDMIIDTINHLIEEKNSSKGKNAIKTNKNTKINKDKKQEKRSDI